jgi:hypothetical protein
MKGRGGGWLVEARKSKVVMSDPAKWIEALTQWHHADQASPLALDPSSRQDSATQANDASGTGQIATAGAIWLAVNGLPFFPVYAGKRSPATSGWWNGREFSYVTWGQPLCLTVVRSICRSPIGRVLSNYGVRQMWTAPTIAAAENSRQLLMAKPMRL